jgi:membrane fusion protein, multidrug efflux system
MMKKIAVIVAALLAAYGIYGYLQSPSEDAAGGQNAAPQVNVITVASKQTRLWTEFSGRLQAVERVDVRPRVRGSIQKILFKEGAYVKAGDPLFVIDPRPYEATLATAKAALAAAESAYALNSTQLTRATKLLKLEGVSRNEYDSAVNQKASALAAIDAAKAAVHSAALDVQFAHIHAPVSGTIGRAEITLGNIVETGSNAPILTTIVSTKDLFAEFDVDEKTYLERVKAGAASAMPVEVVVSEKGIPAYEATIRSFDNQMSVDSGTIRARAYVNNHDNALIPGLYVTVRLGSVDEQPIISIPQRAVQTDQSNKFVYVVDAANKIAFRPIEIGNNQGDSVIITNGLQEGEKVVVGGLQRIRPDMEVVPVSDTDADEKNAALLTK